MLRRAVTLAALAAVLGSCHDDDGKAKGPIIRGLAVGDSVVPTSALPPFGLTWFIRFNNNVPLATLQGLVPRVNTLNTRLWNVSEGQIYLARVIISDNVAPGTRASGGVPALADGIDAVVFVGTTWDLPGILGFVQLLPERGREGRAVAVPDNADDNTWIHEGAHLVFRLSWPPGPLLVDEYTDGMQDAACIMEDTYAPLRWCSAGNHVAQASQPRSCWQQILMDYPLFRFTGTAMGPPPVPTPRIDIADEP